MNQKPKRPYGSYCPSCEKPTGFAYKFKGRITKPSSGPLQASCRFCGFIRKGARA